MTENPYENKQLYAIVGGHLEFVHMKHFKDLNDVKCFGFFDNKTEATAAWKSLAMSTIDDAHMKYYIVKVY